MLFHLLSGSDQQGGRAEGVRPGLVPAGQSQAQLLCVELCASPQDGLGLALPCSASCHSLPASPAGG